MMKKSKTVLMSYCYDKNELSISKCPTLIAVISNADICSGVRNSVKHSGSGGELVMVLVVEVE